MHTPRLLPALAVSAWLNIQQVHHHADERERLHRWCGPETSADQGTSGSLQESDGHAHGFTPMPDGTGNTLAVAPYLCRAGATGTPSGELAAPAQNSRTPLNAEQHCSSCDRANESSASFVADL